MEEKVERVKESRIEIRRGKKRETGKGKRE